MQLIVLKRKSYEMEHLQEQNYISNCEVNSDKELKPYHIHELNSYDIHYRKRKDALIY